MLTQNIGFRRAESNIELEGFGERDEAAREGWQKDWAFQKETSIVMFSSMCCGGKEIILSNKDMIEVAKILRETISQDG